MVRPLKCKDFLMSELKVHMSKEFPTMPQMPIRNNTIKATKFRYDMTQTVTKFYITDDD